MMYYNILTGTETYLIYCNTLITPIHKALKFEPALCTSLVEKGSEFARIHSNHLPKGFPE